MNGLGLYMVSGLICIIGFIRVSNNIFDGVMCILLGMFLGFIGWYLIDRKEWIE